MDADSVGRGQGQGQGRQGHGVGGRRGPLLSEVVCDVVAEVAREELPIVAGMRGLDDDELRRRLARRTNREDPLGFGLGEAVVLAAPIIYGAVQHIVDQMTGSAVDGLFARVRALFRRLLGRARPAAPLPQFSRVELREVRDRVLEMATQAGMKQARAEQLADSVVGRLALNGVADRKP